MVTFRFMLVLPGLVVLLSSSALSHAQADPAAVKPLTLQVGGGFSYARPDVGLSYIEGFTVYGDAVYHHRIGVEVNVHDNSLHTPTAVAENSYMVGPIVSLIHEDRANVYVRGMAGVATFAFNPTNAPHTSSSYGAYALGAGIEFRASRRINIRCADIEQEWWPGYQPRGLSPFVATFGAAYRF